MLHSVVPIVLLAFGDPAGAAPPSPAPQSQAQPQAAATIVSFRTDAAPRIDPVFGDVAALRASIDRFLSLQGEMDRVRDDFSSAVHATLAALAASEPAATTAEPRQCPSAAGAPHARALASGGRYLALGQQLQSVYREIRRAEDLGDTLGLTPDYKLRAKKAKDLHQQLLSDYREMRVAFYDQLGAELRHAGCKLTAKGLAAVVPPDANPSDPGAWDLAEPGGAAGGADATPTSSRSEPLSSARLAMATRSSVARTAANGPPLSAEAAANGAAPAIWIEIDNALCNESTRLAIDGQALGEIGARNKTSVRARSGPHEVCALPSSDRRSCGDAGTLRKAYLHEGWQLTIHCAK